MATKYLCNRNILISGALYESGKIYEFDADPGAAFSATSDPRMGNLGLSRDMDGTLYFPGEGWEDLRFPSTGINPPGPTDAPARDEVDATLVFSKSATNVIAGVAQMPHSWKLGSPVECHIHWEIPADTTGAVVWKFESACADLEGLFPETYASTTTTVTVDSYVPRQHIITNVGWVIPGTNISAIIKWKLSRLGAELTDNYDNTAKLLEMDFHYQIDSVGSGREREK